MALPARPSEAAWSIAETIVAGFNKHYRLFREISADAQRRFERGVDRDIDAGSRSRSDCYEQRVIDAVEALERNHP